MVVPIVIGGYGSGACLPEKFENYKPGNCISSYFQQKFCSKYKPCIFVYCLLYISVVKFLPMIIVYSKRSITQIHNMFHFPKTIILVKPMAVSRKKEKCISTLHAMMTQ